MQATHTLSPAPPHFALLGGRFLDAMGAGVSVAMRVKRKATSKRLRFEIFARDGFRCRYCGRSSSDVRLVIDHITPVAAGGLTEPENLITACNDCNAGKAATTIEQHVPSEEDAVRREQELREQEHALAVARETAAAREETRQAIVNYVCAAYKVEETYAKNIDVLLYYYYQHGPVVFEWIDIASRAVRHRQCSRYVSGIRRRILNEQQASAAPQVTSMPA